MESDGYKPRNRDDAEWELRFSIRLLARYGNLARNADFILNLATLIGLATASGALFGSIPSLATIAGGILALVSILQIIYKPAEAKVTARFSRAQYVDLWSRWHDLDDIELDRAVTQMHGNDIGVVEGLRLVAEVDTARELGLDHTEIESRMNAWNKLLRACS